MLGRTDQKCFQQSCTDIDRILRAPHAARMKALGHYLAKFSDVKALFDQPKSPDEETIAQRLKAANMYCLKPRWIRLIDNGKRFGFKAEFEL